MQRLQWQILRQDPQLEAEPPKPPLAVPAPLTAFVGRATAVEQVAQAVADILALDDGHADEAAFVPVEAGLTVAAPLTTWSLIPSFGNGLTDALP